jgi:hypothetical protein
VAQYKAYNHFIQSPHLLKYKWSAFIDADEFVVLKQHANIVDFLTEYCPNGSIALNWYVYGEGKVDNINSETDLYDVSQPVTKRFLYREPLPNRHVKCFFRTEHIAHIQCCHCPTLKPGQEQRDTNGQPFQGPWRPDGPTNIAYINHYYFKSVQEYAKKYMTISANGDEKGTTWAHHPTRLDQEDVSAHSTILLYIVCHDDTSCIKATAYANELKATQPAITSRITRVNPKSPYFESQVFGQMNVALHYKYKWIGVITYSFKDKLGSNTPNIQEEVTKAAASASTANVVSLFNLDFSKPRVNRPVSFAESVAMQHGPFLWMAIYHLFKVQGFKAEDLLQTKSGFFSNWWLASPKAMAAYISFYKNCVKLVETHPLISKYIMEDSYYLGYGHKKTVTDESLIETFGRDRYCLHPFVFERLPAFFFGLKGMTVHRGGVTASWPLSD